MTTSLVSSSDGFSSNVTVQKLDTTNDDVTEAEDSALVIIFQKVLPLFLLLVGTAGNTLTIMALRQNKRLKSAFRIYHTVLACFDLLVLYVCLVRFWFLGIVHFDLRHGHEFVCKGQAWLEHSCLLVPSWILVAMTMQLYDALGKPHSLGTNLTRSKALLYSGTAVFTAVFGNAHILLGFGDMSSVEERNSTVSPDSHLQTGEGFQTSYNSTSGSWSRHVLCVPTSDTYAKFVTYAWPWVDTVAIFLGPFIVVGVGFVLIVRLLVSFSKTVPPTDSNGVMLLTSSVLSLDVMFIMMSGPFCVFTMANPFIYENAGAKLSAKQIYVSSVVHGVFYTMFALRWIVTCFCGKLWSYVTAMLKSAKSCRRK